ncbi:MAG: YdcF family protein [Ileibacterium sp.]|nr:YdcF family protein [Ileibacterium sp.]
MNKKRKTGRLAALAFVSAAAAGGYLIYRHYLPKIKKDKEPAKYPFALVLGCPNRKDGSMSTSQIKRCECAIDAYQKGLFDILVISGGAVKNDKVEALEMQNYIEEHSPVKIPMIAETSAQNTWENFKLVSQIIQDNPVLIITSSLHARRSAATAAHFFSDWNVITYPEYRPKHILREIPSRLIYIKLEMQKDLAALKEDLQHVSNASADELELQPLFDESLIPESEKD